MQPKEMVFDVGATGTVTGLHFDEFPLNFLGKVAIGRASEIFWDEMDQSWSVKLPNQAEPSVCNKGFAGYDEARKFEVNWLQECRKLELAPDSSDGLIIAAWIRSGKYPWASNLD